MYTREELAAEGLLDFRVFLCHVWAFLGLPEPTLLQLDIAWWMQWGPDKSIIEAFRGAGKSWMVVAYALWRLLLNNQENIVMLSASATLANENSKFAKMLIEGMPLLQHLKPKEGQRDSAISFDVYGARPSKDPSMKSVGITGQVTGTRADCVIPDDIEIPKNSYTHLLRERLSELVKEVAAILKPGGVVRYLGTPQIEETLYNKLETRGYTTRIWPAEIPENTDAYRGRLGPYIQKLIDNGATPGTPTEPLRYPREVLDQKLAEYGRAGYALQYMLDTSPSDADRYPLKLHDCIVHDVDADMGHVKLIWSGHKDHTLQDLAAGGLEGDRYQCAAVVNPTMADYTSTIMAIDPSGRGSDETAYAVLKMLYGTIYLVDVGGFLEGFSELTLRMLAGKAARWKVNKVLIEENYGGGMFTSMMRPFLLKAGNACDLNPEDWDGWSRGQKEMRILDIMEPIVQSHRFVIDRRVIEADLKMQAEKPQYSFIQQFTRMSRARGALPHEDRLEAVSMGCDYFTSQMDKDQDIQISNRREDLRDEEFRKFSENCYFPRGREEEEDELWNQTPHIGHQW